MKNHCIIETEFFLDRVIRLGFEYEVIDAGFLNTFREYCAHMTMELANKYYKIHYAVDLRTAANDVLGVCNLGAILIGSEVQVISFLKARGFVALFQKGFTALSDLSKKTQLQENEVDRLDILSCLKLVSVSNKDDWNGFNRYKKELEKALEFENYVEFLNWCLKRYTSFSTRMININKKEKIVRTIVLTFFFTEKITGTLSMGEFIDIFAQLSDEAMQFDNFIREVPEKVKKSATKFLQIFELDVKRITSAKYSGEELLIFSDEFFIKETFDKLIYMKETFGGI